MADAVIALPSKVTMIVRCYFRESYRLLTVEDRRKFIVVIFVTTHMFLHRQGTHELIYSNVYRRYLSCPHLACKMHDMSGNARTTLKAIEPQ